MPAWLLSIGKWVGLNFILPLLKDLVISLYEKIKRKKKYDQEVKQDEQKTEDYQSKPSDSTFGDAP